MTPTKSSWRGSAAPGSATRWADHQARRPGPTSVGRSGRSARASARRLRLRSGIAASSPPHEPTIGGDHEAARLLLRRRESPGHRRGHPLPYRTQADIHAPLRVSTAHDSTGSSPTVRRKSAGSTLKSSTNAGSMLAFPADRTSGQARPRAGASPAPAALGSHHPSKGRGSPAPRRTCPDRRGRGSPPSPCRTPGPTPAARTASR